jgi:ABC-type phosphate transport system substrate-binding protein
MGGPLLLLGLALGQKVSVYEGCATNAASSNAFGERLAGELEVCGAGASLPASLYQLTAFAYSSRGTVSYASTGSTLGKDSANFFTVDFAGSDSLLSDAQYAQSPDLQVLCAGARPRCRAGGWRVRAGREEAGSSLGVRASECKISSP